MEHNVAIKLETAQLKSAETYLGKDVQNGSVKPNKKWSRKTMTEEKRLCKHKMSVSMWYGHAKEYDKAGGRSNW